MTIQTSAIAYRSMNENDLPAAHVLSQAVRWPHRIEDWQFVQRLGTGFVAEENGAVVGTGLCWKQGSGHGSLGMIIVSQQHQGKGIGRQLMQLVLEELGQRCTLLNATVAGQPLYESLGFKATGTLFQHQGTMAAVAPVVLQESETIRKAKPGDLAGMIALANRASGMARDEVLRQLAAVSQHSAWLMMANCWTAWSCDGTPLRAMITALSTLANPACASHSPRLLLPVMSTRTKEPAQVLAQYAIKALARSLSAATSGPIAWPRPKRRMMEKPASSPSCSSTAASPTASSCVSTSSRAMPLARFASAIILARSPGSAGRMVSPAGRATGATAAIVP